MFWLVPFASVVVGALLSGTRGLKRRFVPRFYPYQPRIEQLEDRITPNKPVASGDDCAFAPPPY